MSKFCVNCGATLDDNAGFCGSCGAKQDVPAAPQAPAASVQAPVPPQAPIQPQVPPQPQAPVAPTPAAAGNNDAAAAAPAKMSPDQMKKIGIIAAIAAAALIVIIVAVVVVTQLTKYQKIDCKDLYYVSYNGINGEATANVFLATASNITAYDNNLYAKYEESDYYDDYYDYDTYEKFLDSLTSDWLKTDSKDMKKVWTKFDSKNSMKKAQEKLIEEVEFKIDEDELKNLSNGDTINVKVKYSEDKLKKRNIKLINTEFTITVEGLVEPEVLDPLGNVTLNFSGKDGRGNVELDTSSLSDIERDAFYIYIDGYYYNELSNGDTVTVVASPNYYMSDGYFTIDGKYYTYVEGALTKEFKVEGLQGLSVLDPFEGVELSYSGIAPELNVSVNTDNCVEAIKNCISFELDKSRGVAIGDTITVTATVKSWYEDDFVEYGYKLESASVTKTYIIDATAPHYINDIKAATTIDAEALFESVIKKINESSGNYLAGTYLNSKVKIASIKSITVDDAYLVAPSDIATSSNTYYQIFKVVAACTVDGASEDKTYYVMAIADSAYVDSDGALQYDDWWISTVVSESKSNLIDKNVKTDSNQVDGKTITSTAPESAAPASDSSSSEADADSSEAEEAAAEDTADTDESAA